MNKMRLNSIGTVSLVNELPTIQLNEKYIPALQALDGFNHLQIFWWADECDTKEMRSVLETPKPYKNAPDVMGVFATRSPLRPNPIALSTVQVISIDYTTGAIQIPYIDANNGTAILDIKPYTPSMDRPAEFEVPDWCKHWPMSIEESGEFDWENEFLF